MSGTPAASGRGEHAHIGAHAAERPTLYSGVGGRALQLHARFPLKRHLNALLNPQNDGCAHAMFGLSSLNLFEIILEDEKRYEGVALEHRAVWSRVLPNIGLWLALAPSRWVPGSTSHFPSSVPSALLPCSQHRFSLKISRKISLQGLAVKKLDSTNAVGSS